MELASRAVGLFDKAAKGRTLGVVIEVSVRRFLYYDDPGEVPIAAIRTAFLTWYDERVALARAEGGQVGARMKAAAWYARAYLQREIEASPALVLDTELPPLDAALRLLERRFSFFCTSEGFAELPEGRPDSPTPIRLRDLRAKQTGPTGP